ncbi:MAG TPA: aldo/keto reductase, partial [Tepidisphaeraceae bacterium]|nr:aldo/keto reductase [Tepidisphaeraceae bacterium]
AGVQSVQIIFNVFRRKPAERFFEIAKQKQVGILARVPLASGLLTGKMTLQSAFAMDDHRFYNRGGKAFDIGETFSGVEYGRGLQAVDALRPLVPAGVPMSAWALRWILMFDAVTCAIPGAKNTRQVEQNMSAADLPELSKRDMDITLDIYNRYIRELVHERW